MQKNIHPPSRQTAMQTPPSLRGAKRRSSLGIKLAKKLQTLFKLLLLSITLTTTLLAQDMYRPPYESTLNIEPRAKQWYKDAAVDSDGAFNIAYTYDEKLHNLQKAKQWYQYAWSLKQEIRIAVNLGLVYKELKEYDKAKQWYEKAADRESKDGMFNLALLYHEHYKEYDKAIKWYEKAIEKNNENAMYNLALLYDEHYKEYDKAIELYKKAHEMGYPNAASNLGHLYANTLKYYDNAKIWYQIAIDSGNFKGVRNIAWMYYRLGKDVTAAAYMFNLIVYFSNGSKTKEKQELKETIEFLKDEWNLDDQTIQKGYELQLTMDNLPKKYRGGVR